MFFLQEILMPDLFQWDHTDLSLWYYYLRDTEDMASPMDDKYLHTQSPERRSPSKVSFLDESSKMESGESFSTDHIYNNLEISNIMQF